MFNKPDAIEQFCSRLFVPQGFSQPTACPGPPVFAGPSPRILARLVRQPRPVGLGDGIRLERVEHFKRANCGKGGGIVDRHPGLADKQEPAKAHTAYVVQSDLFDRLRPL